MYIWWPGQKSGPTGNICDNALTADNNIVYVSYHQHSVKYLIV